ncbi:hypothetical protein [Flavobacterium aquatile]|uniref:Uncharacterized protein n=1 Tax=Flavobacterium aquatile LMG 4008 = ATCC 11947 TaxID=1453498 RepID=A0A095SRF9_9FLAO|nr:hypothetical protein [Flavobacterium aquatile]KGD67142.1 hypothetical protein LG45_13020 [Flavobacterium aquatile LMG 4008 = ATCC 11947]OXA66700.1 hypothetical protein B0A61_10885 [Flavobacterium aquatile LMG 4008 = ATCC 11947]GEC78438.1 hypothetical protein FAQ01_13080 [Flavobacterium aquatile]
MKKLNNAFSILMMIIVLILGVVVYKDFEKENKFEKQNLGTNLELFKDYWGNPDKKFVEKSELILIYNSSIINGDKYVFKFNNQSKILESKFYDD